MKKCGNNFRNGIPVVKFFLWRGLIIMIQKNKDKEDAKKRRNFWPISPVTRVKQSKKIYKRKGRKKNEKTF
jgi:hypothetical protein